MSFAEFEREMIAERTRDKMSAARKKGKWVGGRPTLGYDVDPSGRRLVVNEREAARVREAFELYLQERSLMQVVDILAMPPIEPRQEPIREPEMRTVLREVLWSEQRNRWGALLKKASLSVPSLPVRRGVR